ncbi:DEAD/DEAH box helicase [archaeon]|jgi:ATP-dependent RNA helicase RhlE|nr:DEAD/DEAH box helicase [archaeon]
MKFESLDIIDPILRALKTKGYVKPSPIQEKTIPLLLEDRDVIGIAQTGTGKTAAFVVPVLQKLHERSNGPRGKNPRALILAPTRELAAQISESFDEYGKFLNLKHLAVYGGVGIIPQVRALQHGVDILIATPGRLMDLMNQRKITLRDVEFFVLDEADRMLDMGFVHDVKKIASSLSVERQNLFFSATMNKAVSDLSMNFLRNPVRIDITPESTPVDKIEQCVFFVDQYDKNELLLDLIKQQNMTKVLVFVGMKYKADRVVDMLGKAGISAEAIHGNKSQYQRTRALNNFKSGRARVLVATDIAARGIDIKDIGHVINFDLPNEPENYVHRIGRTARAGKDGTAYSFCAACDRNFLHQIERITKQRIEHADHKYHSLSAKNAVGAAAKPAPRRGFGGGGRGRSSGGRGNSRGGRDNRSRGNSGRSRDSGRSRTGGSNRGRGNASGGSRDGGRGRSSEGRSRGNSGGHGRSARGDSPRGRSSGNGARGGRGRSFSGNSAGRNRSRR